jgi:ribose 1,5-bisphosphokinase PhnN
MRQRFLRSGTILVSADPAIIAARLSARGREDASDQASRLARSAPSSRDFSPDIVVENNGPLAEACAAFIDAINGLVAETAPVSP